MFKGILGAAAVMALMGATDARPAIHTRPYSVRPKPSREERKRRRRMPHAGRPEKLAARSYVAHEAGTETHPLCRPRWTLPFGPHRLARHGEAVMCNDCQRRRWQLDQQSRKAA